MYTHFSTKGVFICLIYLGQCQHYEDLYNFLQRNHFKERYKKTVLDNPYMPKRTEFDAKDCLAAALSYLTEIGEVEAEEIHKIIINESYRGIYKLLERGIQK